MTKQHYLAIRQSNPSMLIYEKYKENYNAYKHGKMMSPTELLTFLPMWRNPQDILQSIIEEYDERFGVVQLFDRNGQLIKLL